jgi:hypothetical protein
VIAKTLAVGASVALVAVVACSSGDYKLERRGGPFPTEPVTDEPRPSGGGSGGAVAVEPGAGGAAEPTSGAPAAAGAGGSPETPISFCAALVVVQAKCQRCHGDPITNSAPVPFLTYEHFQAQYYDTELKWWEVAVGMVERDVMPFVALNENPSLEGPPVEPLTAEEKATLLGWLKQGALPEGGTDCP